MSNDDLDISPHLGQDCTITVSVAIEVPQAAMAACRRGYESRNAFGADPYFEDFLYDCLDRDFTWTHNGYVLDPATGHATREARQ